eukprot:4507934-Prymnesium_polylepis.1
MCIRDRVRGGKGPLRTWGGGSLRARFGARTSHDHAEHAAHTLGRCACDGARGGGVPTSRDRPPLLCGRPDAPPSDACRRSCEGRRRPRRRRARRACRRRRRRGARASRRRCSRPSR